MPQDKNKDSSAVAVEPTAAPTAAPKAAPTATAAQPRLLVGFVLGLSRLVAELIPLQLFLGS